MAIKLPKFLSGTNAKSRLFFIFAAIAIVSFLILFLVHYLGGGDAGNGSSRLASAPASLQTVPGAAEISPEFNRAITQANLQSSQQAQISGGSAVPILMNIPGQQSFGQNCTTLCPSDDNANVADDINNLVKQGKFSQEDANKLLDLAKNKVTVDEYANSLNELVRQGKLTPEQARDLLEKYKKQSKNSQLAQSSQLMDSMIKSGQLPLAVANQLLALQKSGISTSDYANELNRLVREGKISPETAARLLAQYTQQKAQEQAKQGAFALQQMAKSGEITPDVASALTALQNRNVTVDQYAAELNRLVAAGKMTPAAAAKLLEQYKQQKAGLGTVGTLNSIVGQEEDRAQGVINDLVKSGKLSKEDAAALSAMEKNANSPEDCQHGITQFVQAKKLAPEDAKTLLESCKRVAAVRAEAQRLAKMQGNNVSPGDYENELKRAVQAGLISPEAAAALLEQYRAAVAPASMTAPGPSALAGGAATTQFAQLQQRVSENTVAPAIPIATPPTPAEQATLQTLAAEQVQNTQAQQQRFEQMQSAMAAQAQTLIAAWQLPIMVHKEGSAPVEKGKSGTETITTTTTTSGGKAGGSASSKPALIKAGTILFAVLETAVDSDYPDTPVMATIISGDLKGAKLLGKLSLVTDKDKISLNFNLMDKEGWPTTKSISAFAIDPDTARTVMASSVDYHYMKRYGAIMATSFLTGYSSAITQAGTSTTGIFGTSTTHPALSPTQKLAVGLGQIGTTMGAALAPNINTPTTVKVNSGVGLGILFMGEVKE